MKSVKYGMPASESDQVVENHFVVMEERKLLRDMYFARALQHGPLLSTALAKVAKA